MNCEDNGELDALRRSDPIAGKTLTTLGRRLIARDPGVLGTYAEHRVAEAIGGKVSSGGWDPYDIVWDRVEPDGTTSRIEIQVKLAGLHRVFAEGVVNSVSFGTRSTRPLESVWANDGAGPSHARVWVFALHTSSAHDRGWRFFVCPGAYLKRLGASSIALNSLVVRLGHPVSDDELASSISHAFDHPDDFVDASTWECPRCDKEYDALRQLTAHQAVAGHAWSHTDLFRDSPQDGAEDGCPVVPVPGPTASLDVVYKFAHTFDGYGRYGRTLASVAAPVERFWRESTRFPADINRLRAALFFTQRAWRHSGEVPEEQDCLYERALVKEIDHLSAGLVSDERPIRL